MLKSTELEYKPQKYKFIETDIEELAKLGYQIINAGSMSFEIFMQKMFPNFNLVSLLKVVENRFNETTAKNIYRNLYYDEFSGTLKVEYGNEFTNEDDALLFIREFSTNRNTIEIKHEYCVLPKKYRNKGLIKPVFQESLQQYVNMNAKRILVHAGLSGGGYTWAKYGFVAVDKNEVTFILDKAKTDLNENEFEVIKKIYDRYYSKNPKGKSFPWIYGLHLIL